jgi:hypothetical protein
MLLVPLIVLSAVSFVYYGVGCLASPRLREEYLRYGVPHLRVISATLQLLGAAGVVIGLMIEPIGVAAATGLCVMMTLGVVVRMRMHDTFRVMLPAASLAVINGALVVLFVAG